MLKNPSFTFYPRVFISIRWSVKKNDFVHFIKPLAKKLIYLWTQSAKQHCLRPSVCVNSPALRLKPSRYRAWTCATKHVALDLLQVKIYFNTVFLTHYNKTLLSICGRFLCGRSFFTDVNVEPRLNQVKWKNSMFSRDNTLIR